MSMLTPDENLLKALAMSGRRGSPSSLPSEYMRTRRSGALGLMGRKHSLLIVARQRMVSPPAFSG